MSSPLAIYYLGSTSPGNHDLSFCAAGNIRNFWLRKYYRRGFEDWWNPKDLLRCGSISCIGERKISGRVSTFTFARVASKYIHNHSESSNAYIIREEKDIEYHVTQKQTF